MSLKMKESHEEYLPSVSVVIPSLNNERTIGQTIKSLKDMNYPDDKLEIIVVDDASTDKTGYVALHHGAKVVRREKRGGCAGAKNTGVAHAKNEIIAFIDADVEVDKNWLKELVAPFKDSSVGAVGGLLRIKWGRNYALGKYVDYDIEYRKRDKSTRSVPGSNSAYRQEVFEIVGEMDPYLGEDPDFSYRVSSHGFKVVFTDKAVVHHPSPETVWTYLKKQVYYGWQRTLIFLLRSECRSAVVRDEHTPYAVLLQPLILTALILSLLLIPLFNSFKFLSLILFALWIALYIPFLHHVYTREARLLSFAFFVSVLRSFAYMIGMMQGFISFVKIKIARQSHVVSSSKLVLP